MTEFLTTYFENIIPLKEEIIESTLQTLYMVTVTGFIAGMIL